MPFRIVLTARQGFLDHRSVEIVTHRLGAAVHWLEPGTACDLQVAGDPSDLLFAVREALGTRPVDANVVPTLRRRKKLLLADMDSTIISVECIDEIAAYAGVGGQVAAITERSMRGELNFEDSLRARVALLKDLPVQALEDVARLKVRLNPGARIAVRTMAAHGTMTALVSGGFTFFSGRVAEMAGFAQHHANVLLIENGKLTGAVQEPILGREAKANLLRTLMQDLGLTREDVLAVGDGANDLAMIEAAGLGVAYRAKPLLRDAAAARLDHSDLTALLYLQGCRSDEIVTD